MTKELTLTELDSQQSGRQAGVPRKSEIMFEFTRDPAYLHQYYLLRARLESPIASLSQMFAQADAFDARSHILVARKGNQVIAGARLTISSPRLPQSLPMEADSVDVAPLLQHYDLSERKYAEVSAWVIEPEFLNNSLYDKLFYHLNRKMLAAGVVRYFGLAPEFVVKQFRQMMRGRGADLFICNFLQSQQLSKQLFTSQPLRIRSDIGEDTALQSSENQPEMA
jgi:hypothetical protein